MARHMVLLSELLGEFGSFLCVAAEPSSKTFGQWSFLRKAFLAAASCPPCLITLPNSVENFISWSCVRLGQRYVNHHQLSPYVRSCITASLLYMEINRSCWQVSQMRSPTVHYLFMNVFKKYSFLKYNLNWRYIKINNSSIWFYSTWF